MTDLNDLRRSVYDAKQRLLAAARDQLARELTSAISDATGLDVRDVKVRVEPADIDGYTVTVEHLHDSDGRDRADDPAPENGYDDLAHWVEDAVLWDAPTYHDWLAATVEADGAPTFDWLTAPTTTSSGGTLTDFVATLTSDDNGYLDGFQPTHLQVGIDRSHLPDGTTIATPTIGALWHDTDGFHPTGDDYLVAVANDIRRQYDKTHDGALHRTLQAHAAELGDTYLIAIDAAGDVTVVAAGTAATTGRCDECATKIDGYAPEESVCGACLDLTDETATDAHPPTVELTPTMRKAALKTLATLLPDAPPNKRANALDSARPELLHPYTRSLVIRDAVADAIASYRHGRPARATTVCALLSHLTDELVRFDETSSAFTVGDSAYHADDWAVAIDNDRREPADDHLRVFRLGEEAPTGLPSDCADPLRVAKAIATRHRH